MDFSLGSQETQWRDRVRDFIEEVRPRVGDYHEQQREGDRWQPLPVIEELKPKARGGGPVEPVHAAGRRAAACRRELRVRGHAAHQPRICALRRGDGPDRCGRREVFNCSAPDTGNMEVLHRYGTREQKERVAEAADERRDPLGLPDDRARRSPRPTRPTSNATSRRDGDDYVINGRKWWSSRRRRSALQGRDPDGQDRPGGRQAPAAVDDPGAARRAGRDDRARAHRLRL